jgi:hypothetical protein
VEFSDFLGIHITKILRNGNGLLRMPREYTGVLGFFLEYLDYSAALIYINPSSKLKFQSYCFSLEHQFLQLKTLLQIDGQKIIPKLHFGEFVI